MLQSHQLSFRLSLGLIFLTPLFFIPGGALSLQAAKTTLFTLGCIAVCFTYLVEVWKAKKISWPKHNFLYVLIALPTVYLVSALLAVPSSLALFGYSFEVGTFGFMLIGSIFVILISIIFSQKSYVLQGLAAIFFSLVVVTLFAIVKLAFGSNSLEMGNFFGNTSGPLGGWTDLSVGLGLLSLLSLLVLGMLPMKKPIRIGILVTFFVSTILFVAIGFVAALVFALLLSVVLGFYFYKIEKDYLFSDEDNKEKNTFRKSIILPIVLGAVSLIFLINPPIPAAGGNLRNFAANIFNLENTEVQPSYSATLSVSKAVLSQDGLLGSGPNTFAQDWLIYKPNDINATPFWSTNFPYGAGFIPTQIATTGLLGTTCWLVFFTLLIFLGLKALSHVPESRVERFNLFFAMLGTFFLWGASFFYTPSSAILFLTFVFTGIFVAILNKLEVIPISHMGFATSLYTRRLAGGVMVALVLGIFALGCVSIKRALAAYYFNRAINLSNTKGVAYAEIGASLSKAISISPADIHHIALSRLHLMNAEAVSSSQEGTEEERLLIIQDSLAKSIDSARLAINANPASYENWIALGSIYSALVPAPISVEGAYENAVFAYNEAARRNPTNPQTALLLAQLEINNKNADGARGYIRNALALKPDYADAYIMLAQLEVSAGNTQAAIASAENLALLAPNNPGIHFEIGLLKYLVKDFAGAATSLRQAVILSPTYANAKYYLALALAELGNFKEAKIELEELRETNPGNADLLRVLEAVNSNRIPGSAAPAGQ